MESRANRSRISGTCLSDRPIAMWCVAAYSTIALFTIYSAMFALLLMVYWKKGEKVKVYEVRENCPLDQHCYVVYVCTSVLPFSSANSTFQCRLVGRKAQSDWCTLQADLKKKSKQPKLLQSASVDRFLIRTASSLGKCVY